MSRSSLPPIPHSWPVSEWTEQVYPNDPKKGCYLVREHRAELLACGALVRVGRSLVIIGPRFVKWLELQASRVPDYECAANAVRVEKAAARDIRP